MDLNDLTMLLRNFIAGWAWRMGALARVAEARIYHIAGLWALGFGTIAFLRIWHSHAELGLNPSARDFFLYAALALAPLAALRLADLTFPHGKRIERHLRRPFSTARWHQLDDASARAHPSYGTSGLLAALALGLLGNIGFRCGEFLLAMPPSALEGPHWAQILSSAMMLDALFFSLAYGFAFVMAIRHARTFPYVLVCIWLADLTAQLLIAQALATTLLPAQVAPALAALLIGNLKKTLITITIWLPYLILSTRVNVTYHHRMLKNTAS